MADEITILESDGSFRFRLCLIFPIASPAQVGGANVIPTPSVDLPTIANQLLSTVEKSTLDAGTTAFKVVQLRKDASLTNPQFEALAAQKYTEELTDFNRWYAQTYLHAGQRFNA